MDVDAEVGAAAPSMHCNRPMAAHNENAYPVGMHTVSFQVHTLALVDHTACRTVTHAYLEAD